MKPYLHLFGTCDGQTGYVQPKTTSYHIPHTGEIYERVLISSGGFSRIVFVLANKTHKEVLDHMISNFKAPKK